MNLGAYMLRRLPALYGFVLLSPQCKAYVGMIWSVRQCKKVELEMTWNKNLWQVPKDFFVALNIPVFYRPTKVLKVHDFFFQNVLLKALVTMWWECESSQQKLYEYTLYKDTEKIKIL